MQALVLAGGEGTRLRPLTSTFPKPVVPLVDRPFLVYMIEWLRTHGVDDIVVGCGHMAAGVHDALGDGSAFGVQLRYVEEPHPLGTGGALKYAEPLLDERFLMLNGDVLTDLDLTAQIGQHEATGARATLGLVPVDDPSAYGLVRTEDDGVVREFVEKPSPDQIDTNLISAGMYVLEREVLNLIPADQHVSIEREVFPRLIGNGLYARGGDGYWLDIGTPASYLQATFDILEGIVHTGVEERLRGTFLHVAGEPEGRVIPPALVERGCTIAADAHVGARVVLGRDVAVGAGSVVESAVVLNGAEIGADCRVSHSIIGPGVEIGDGCVIDEGVVLGEGVTVGAHNVLRAGARVFPGVSLPDGAIAF